MSILTNQNRIGCFSSSEIYVLMTEPTLAAKKAGEIFSKGALTYIQEKNFERKLGRSIDTEADARALTWGKLTEAIAFNKLGLSYIINSDETTTHPEINYWCGSDDCKKRDKEGLTIADLKNPLTLSSFCKLVEPLYDGFNGMEAINFVRDNHKDGEKFFWQIVSGCCIHNAEYGELIVHLPYRKFLPDIRLAAKNAGDDEGSGKYWWIVNASDDALPWLQDDGYYRDINTIRFKIDQEDKDLLTNRVKAAGKLLIPYQNKADKSKTDILK